MSSTDYARVERAIRYLEQNAERQPDLAEIAASVDLSPYHFQRLFRRWAGVSPKRFLQFLTAEDAKRRLKESRSLLDVTYDVGLSSPSRLHDLLVSVDGVTPGEVRHRGTGLSIRYGVHPSPFGDCLLAVTERGICHLSFLSGKSPAQVAGGLAREWPQADLQEEPATTGPLARRLFAHPPGDEAPPLPLLVHGTNFQLKVWQGLLRIPPGALIAYGDLADRLGIPGGARAVGGAVGRNPIAFLIPCHRVIRSSGAFGEYGGGRERKRALLGWEASWTATRPTRRPPESSG